MGSPRPVSYSDRPEQEDSKEKQEGEEGQQQPTSTGTEAVDVTHVQVCVRK